MSVIASDPFTRADAGTLGANWTANSEGGGIGFQIVSNAAQPNGAGSLDSSCNYSAASWPNDQYSKVTLGTVGAAGVGVGSGPTCYADHSGTARTYYRLVGNGSGYELGRMVASAFTSLSSGSGTTFTTGDVLELWIKVNGANRDWTCKKNGTTFASGTDTSPITSGDAGIGFSSFESSSANAVILDWEGGDFGASGPTINTQPTDQSVAEGATATFNYAATSSGGALTAQVQKNLGQGAGWVNAGGADTSTTTYTTPATNRANDGGTLYRVVFTDSNGSTTSNVVLLGVTAIPATYTGDGFVIGGSYVGEGMIGAPNLAGGAMNAAGASVDTGTAQLTTAIQAAAAGVTVNTGAAALTTAIQLAIAGQSQATGTAALTTQILMAAAGQAVASGSAAMSTGIPLNAVGVSVASGNGILTTQITLTAAGLVQALGSAALDSGINLAAAGQSVDTGTGALTTQIVLAAIAQAIATGTASLTAQIQLNGAGFTVATGTADLTANGGGFAAGGQSQAGGSAQLSTAIRLVGAGAALGTGSAALDTAIRLAATGQASATGGAALATGIPLQAIGVTAGNGTGSLTTSITLSAQGWSQVILAGGLTTVIQMSAAGISQVAGTGLLTSAFALGWQPTHRAQDRARNGRAEQRARRFRADNLDRTFTSAANDRTYRAKDLARSFQAAA